MLKAQSKRYIPVILSIISLVIIVIILISDSISEGLPYNRSGLEIHEKSIMTGFTITAYCPGPCCNGEWPGMTFDGTPMSTYSEKGISIAAVDPDIIPIGSYIWYRDTKYLAADVGTLIKGRTIDILVPDHGETLKFGKHIGETIHVIFPDK